MFVLSAILSIGLVALTYFTYRREGSSTHVAVLPAAVSGFIGFCLPLPTLCLHAVLVIPALYLWKSRQWTANSLVAYMALVAVAPYGLFSYLAAKQIAEHDGLRRQYAFESMESRLPTPKKHVVTKLSKETDDQLTQLEKAVGDQSDGFRAIMLQRLHEESVRDFIASPGFGVGRRISPSEWTLKVNLDHDGKPIPQPGSLSSSVYQDDDLREPSDVNHDLLRSLHMDSVVDFANPRGFGWVVSRQKVAGFQSHQFNSVPHSKQWRVQTLELVGLLMHDDPVVYVSNELPLMDKLRMVPTRSLNAFEVAGINRLEEGDDLFVRETNETLRMLGAVRSVEQCVRCHGGERGDLLGAFSYRLQRVP